MTDKLERVARAICGAHYKHRGWNKAVYERLEDVVGWNWRSWRKETQAAIDECNKLNKKQRERLLALARQEEQSLAEYESDIDMADLSTESFDKTYRELAEIREIIRILKDD